MAKKEEAAIMSAPESTPELSVVPDEPAIEARKPARPQPAPEVAPSTPGRATRRGAPWWLLVVLAVVGLGFFLNQYLRAERLDARVGALTDELAAADQRLEVANQTIAAHQRHLERVRSGVAALSDQVADLRVLADRDPLAPVPPVASPAESSALSAPSAPAAETGVPTATEDAATGIESDGPATSAPLTDAEGYYWRVEGSPPVSAEAGRDEAPAAVDLDASERRAIIEGATSTRF